MSLQLCTAEAFVASRGEKTPWIMRPFLMRGSSMMLYGRQGIGKSSILMQLAHSFITGEPWLGFPVERTGPVVYLSFDMAVEEARRLIERAEEAGMDFQGQLYMPTPDVEMGEQISAFDIYKQARQLQQVVAEVKPIAVILDTADDGYESPQFKGVTEVAREVVKMYRRACGKAAFVFVRHERKKPPKFGKAKDDDDDPDAYSGPKEWEAVASASLQLARLGAGCVLRVRKSRIDKPPLTELALAKTDYGFFQQTVNHQQMLQYWPYCLPREEQEHALTRVKSMNDVFADVAQRTGSQVEAIKKVYQRAVGVEFPWKALLNGNGDHA